MSTIETELLAALEDLDAKVKTMATANPKPNLIPVFERIDELGRQLPPDADPSLCHYIQRKSYEKARLWLLGRGAENAKGKCGH